MAILNFDKDNLITGVNKIDSFLYWTDDVNEPRRVDADAFPFLDHSTGTTIVNGSRFREEDISVGRRIPTVACHCSPSTTLSSGLDNPLEDRIVRFSYRWRYTDGSYSPMATFSPVAFYTRLSGGNFGSRYNVDFKTGDVPAVRNLFSHWDVLYQTGGHDVDQVQLLYKESTSTTVYILDSVDVSNTFNEAATYQYNGANPYTALPSDQLLRTFDNIPLVAKSQEITGNRLVYGNYVTGFDGLSSITVPGDYVFVERDNTTSLQPVNFGGTVKGDRNYTVGYVFADKFGRQSPVITSPESEVYVPFTAVTSSAHHLLTIGKPSVIPDFATGYRVVVKENKMEYDVLLGSTIFKDGDSIVIVAAGGQQNKVTSGDNITMTAARTTGGVQTNLTKNTFQVEQVGNLGALGYERVGAPFMSDTALEFDIVIPGTGNNDGDQVITSASIPATNTTSNSDVIWGTDGTAIERWDPDTFRLSSVVSVHGIPSASTFLTNPGAYDDSTYLGSGVRNTDGTGIVFDPPIVRGFNQSVVRVGVKIEYINQFGIPTSEGVATFNAEQSGALGRSPFLIKLTGNTSALNSYISSNGDLQINSVTGIVFETDARQNPIDIFYETSTAGPIEELEALSDEETINVSWGNAFKVVAGVEVESYLGNFNVARIDPGPRAFITDEKFGRERRPNAMIHSGVFNSRTDVNRLNQFSIAESITTAVDINTGSIQKLYAEDTQLIIFAENKVYRSPIDKDFLFTAEGQNISTSALNQFFGTVAPYSGEYGISKNPESFAVYGQRKYFTDRNRGVVLRLSQNGLTEISATGMSDYFRDAFRDATEVIGSYDEYFDVYNLTVRNPNLSGRIDTDFATAIDGYHTLSFEEDRGGWSSFKSFNQGGGHTLNNIYCTFNGPDIWLHNSSDVPRNNFYGNQSLTAIEYISNESPTTVKGFKTVELEAEGNWEVYSLTTNLDTGVVQAFKEKDGEHVGFILANDAQGNLSTDRASVRGWYMINRLVCHDEESAELFSASSEVFTNRA